MATWPTYAKFIASGYQVEDEVAVERTQMENGVARERLIDEESRWMITGTIFLRTKQQLRDFENWRKNDIKKIGWFNIRHPINGGTIKARFVAGKVGAIMAVDSSFQATTRQAVLEYYE